MYYTSLTIKKASQNMSGGIAISIFINAILLSSKFAQGSEDNFNGIRLRMAAETWEPYITIFEESVGISYSGIMPKILDYLKSSLNFTTSLYRPKDGAWGAVDERGQWSGMVGMVKRNEVDFALGEL